MVSSWAAKSWGVNQAGQPMNPELYYQIGAFMYWAVGSAFLIPVFLVAGIGLLFNAASEKLQRSSK